MTVPGTKSVSTKGSSSHRKQSKKIQSLVIRHLLDNGTLDLLLPDGVSIEIDITQTNKDGDQVKSDDYCFVSTSRDSRKTVLDSYTVGVTFEDEEKVFVFEDKGEDDLGRPFRRVEIA